MRLEVVEGQRQERAGGLGRVAVAVMVGVEDEADLGLAMLGARPAHAAVADQLPALAQHRREAEVVALGDDRRRADLGVEGLAHLGRVARVPVEVARDVGTRLDGQERLEVGRCEGTQEEPVRGTG